MELTGERRIAAPRARVWDALRDPDILRASIPGCRTLVALGENAYRATAGVKIGPISATFTGDVRLLDLNPPSAYRIEGAGQGGAAGFAKGDAAVKLSDEGSDTMLSYTVHADIGGKLAQLGARLVDASAKQIADQFFSNFSNQVAPARESDSALSAENGLAGAVSRSAVAPGSGSVIPARRPVTLLGFPPIAWVAAAAFVVIALDVLRGYF